MAGPSLGTAWIQVSPSMAGFTRDMNRALNGINAASAGSRLASGFSSAFAKVTKTSLQAVATGLAAAGAATGSLVAGLVKAGGSYNVLQQNSRAALTQILGSQKAVNQQMAQLDDLVSKSPFGKDVFIQGQQQLLAFGMAAKNVIPTLDAVQNAVAATGGSSQQLSEITFVLAQIQAAGKITGEDLMQLGQRGINAAELIGSQMGKTGAEIRKSITAGALGADEAITALTAGMMEQFGGATTLIKQQFTGATDRIKAAWRDTGSVIAEPFISKNGGGQAVIWVNLVADSMRTLQGHVKTAMATITKTATPVFNMITKGLQQVNVRLSSFSMENALAQIKKLGDYTPLITGATAALTAFGLKPIPYLGALGRGFAPVLAGVAALVAASPELRGVVSTFLQGTQLVIPSLKQAGQAAADLGLTLIRELSPVLLDLARGLASVVTDLAPLIPALVDVAGAGVPVVKMVAELAAAIVKLPTPLLAAGAAFVLMKRNMGTIQGAFTALNKPVQFAREGIAAFKQVALGMGGLNALRNALSGVTSSFMSLRSPANLAVGAITVLSGVFMAVAQSQAEAKQRTQEYADTLDDLTGSVTDATRAQLEKVVADANLGEAAKKLGLSTKDAVDYLMGEEDAITKVNQATSGLVDAYDKRTAALSEAAITGNKSVEANTRLSASEEENAKAAKTLSDFLGEQRGLLDDATTAKQELIETTNQSAAAAAHEAEMLDQATDAMSRQAAANGDLIQATYRLQDAQAKAAEAVGNGARVARDAGGNLDVYSQNSKAAVEPLLALVEATNAHVDAMVEQGRSQADIDAALQADIAAFDKVAASAGVGAEEMEKLRVTLGLIPDHTSKRIDFTANTGDAESSVDAFLNGVKKNNKGVLTIDATNNPALAKLGETLNAVSQTAGQFLIDANTDPAIAKQLALLGSVNTETGVLTIDADDENAQAAIEELMKKAQANPHMLITADTTSEAKPAIQDLIEEVWGANPSLGVLAHDAGAGKTGKQIADSIGGQTPSMSVKSHDAGATNTGKQISGGIASMRPDMGVRSHDAGAKQSATGVKNDISNMKAQIGIGAYDNGATSIAWGIRNSINAMRSFIGIGASKSMWADGGIAWGRAFAEGGINAAAANLKRLGGPGVEFYANGESHTAQIAPAGAWRVWAEPETGGEAYIPLAVSKRERSLRILQDVADYFAYQVVPKGAGRFAEGAAAPAVVGESRVGSQVTVNIDTINNPVGEPTAVSLEKELQRVSGLVGGLV